MKKVGLVLFLVLLFSSRLSYVDVRQYQSTQKSVEVKGEVASPGSYEVDVHATIAEIIQAAGGCTAEADLSGINQTLDVGHHSVVVIPTKQEKARVSINTATKEALDELPGIGPSIAQRILDYRDQTPFQSLEQLKEVKGIGDTLYNKLKDLICL